MISSAISLQSLPATTGNVEPLDTAFRRGLRPPRRLTVVEWAERNRVLSRESSRGGRFRVSRREVSRGPLLALTERGVIRHTNMVSTQLYKTTLIECAIGYRMDVDPCPILVVYPDLGAAKMFSRQRFAPMVRDTPCLRPLINPKSAWDEKPFPGGSINMATAESPMDLSARPIGLLVMDEMGRFPASSGSEGDPVMIAEERMAEYKGSSLSLRCGSPTVAGRCPIDAAYLESDQRRAFVPCPHCRHWQSLEWEQVKGPGGKEFEKLPSGAIKAASAALYCVECDKPWTEAERLIALRSISWRQTRVFDCCGRRQVPELWDEDGRALCIACHRRGVSNEHAGFTASKLYAPNQSIVELVSKFARALRKGAQSLKTFMNTNLARAWREDGEAPEWQSVFNKRDGYMSGRVPLPGLFLCGGVDVQKDRIEAGVYAFGRNRQRWMIEHRVLPGPTHQPKVWADLAAMLQETWKHELGVEMPVRGWGIDSGAFTAEVYAFVRTQAGLGTVFAVDGIDSYQGAFIGLGAKESMRDGKKVRRGLSVAKIGVSYCKQELLGAFALERPSKGQEFPPGFVHLPSDITEDQVKQLTAEELTTATKNGRTKREWNTLPGRRNEVLDCCNYARGIAAMLGWERMREKHFRQFEGALGIEQGSNAIETDGIVVHKDEQAPATISQRAQSAIQKPRRRVIRSNYMSR